MQLSDDLAADEKLANFANDNDQSVFKHVFESSFKDAAIKKHEQNDEFFVRMFKDESFMGYVMDLMLPEIYKKLRKTQGA